MNKALRSFIRTGVDKISEAFLLDLQDGLLLYKNRQNPAYLRFVEWQRSKLLSKFTLDSSKTTKKAAINKFLQNQERLRHVLIDEDNRRLALARSWCHLILGDFSVEEMYEECRMSNGTDVAGTYSHCNIEDKFSLPLQGNEHAIRQFEDYLEWDGNLKAAIEAHNKVSTLPFYELSDEARLSTVPKNSETDRVILIGSKLNMFFQQGLMKMIENRLRPFGIDISSQAELHREWVLGLSVTHSHATIDFASASDSISLQLCRYLLPRKWFVWFLRFREHRCQFGTFPMIASMGNAFTFPLETLIFFCLGLACTQRGRETTLADASILVKSRVSVFGDDVIIESRAVSSYIELCQSVGLTVNEGKSFTDACGFRESCGVDAFDFRNVRPWYIKSPELDTDTWQHVVCYFCNLFNRYFTKAIPALGNAAYYGHTTAAFASIFVKLGYMLPVVPSDFPSDAGIQLWHDPLMRQILHFYGVRFKDLRVDVHGTVSFHYWKKQYPDDHDALSEVLHYWKCLKFLLSDVREPVVLSEPLPERLYQIRDKSRYVDCQTTTFVAVA